MNLQTNEVECYDLPVSNSEDIDMSQCIIIDDINNAIAEDNSSIIDIDSVETDARTNDNVNNVIVGNNSILIVM